MSTVKSKNLQVGTDATASNNFTIYQPSTPGGTLRIGVGNADSPTEVGRFTSAGYKPATAPAFGAYQSTLQALSAGTSTKLVFQTEEFDTDSCYDTSTSKFTPTVAGYYQINMCCANSGGASLQLQIFKNGSSVKFGGYNGSTGGASSFSSIVYMNGTTDYLEFYTYSSAGVNTNAAQQRVWVNGSLVRAT